LLELSNDLLAHIESGGTLIVPSRQRATAVRLAHSSAMLAAGRAVWNSPDVLPWSAWVERELDAARARGDSLARRLSAAEEWLLWRDSVREACDGHDVLMPDALIEPVRRAVARLDDYGLPLPRAAGAESAVLLQTRTAFRRRCAELRVLGTSSWQDCAAYLRPSPQLLLAGFAALGPARQQWLEQHGARVWASAAGPAGAGQPPQVIGCDNPLLEAEAAAHWCAEQLARDAGARLLLVLPQLARRRHLWERALSHRLDAPALLGVGSSSGASPYAIEGGLPLPTYPLVASALQLIATATGPVPFEQLSAVLRSPYFAALQRDQCLQLDLWLREHNVAELHPGMLPRLLQAVAQGPGAAAAAVLQAVFGAGPASAPEGAMPAEATPAAWALEFAQLLARSGWPGELPGSDEQQMRMRFDELLGDFAAIAAPLGRLDAHEASALLHGMAQRVAFEPASDDVPVTVTASLDDPITRYDGIWVAGLSADVWPPAAQPEALLPLLLQRDADIPEATADGQLRLALQRMHQWQQRSQHYTLSWSRSESELPRDRSPLLDEPTAPGTPEAATPAAAGFELQAWLVAQAPGLQAWHDRDALPWPPARALRGGIALLELQSLCPFRAVAELRLLARRLPQPQPGIDARLRGQMLHLALERLWQATPDSATLRERSREQTLALVQRCAWSATEQIAARLPFAIEAPLLRRESARAERLMVQLIEWELAREAFEVRSLEVRQPLTLAGASLPLRLDRIDRLADGRLLVIDYKSGAAQAFDAFDPRPPRPQLPAYALAAGTDVAAVMALHLGREGIKARGIADRAGRAPGRGVDVVTDGDAGWRLLQAQWSERLERLMREFLSGCAAVQPQPGACEYCHLQMLCRVDAQVLAAAAAAAADDAPAAQAAQSIGSEGA
jgi:ATP-dependent helicase/nuclease subunit B